MKLYVVFDNGPGPLGGRFVEVEDEEGKGHGPETGARWEQRTSGLWQLGPFRSDAASSEVFDTVGQLAASGLQIDGEHHKQFLLGEIAVAVGRRVEHLYEEGVDRGIAP